MRAHHAQQDDTCGAPRAVGTMHAGSQGGCSHNIAHQRSALTSTVSRLPKSGRIVHSRTTHTKLQGQWAQCTRAPRAGAATTCSPMICVDQRCKQVAQTWAHHAQQDDTHGAPRAAGMMHAGSQGSGHDARGLPGREQPQHGSPTICINWHHEKVAQMQAHRAQQHDMCGAPRAGAPATQPSPTICGESASRTPSGATRSTKLMRMSVSVSWLRSQESRLLEPAPAELQLRRVGPQLAELQQHYRSLSFEVVQGGAHMAEIADTLDSNGLVGRELYDLDEVLATEIHRRDYCYQSSAEDNRLIGELRSMLMEGRLMETTPAHIPASMPICKSLVERLWTRKWLWLWENHLLKLTDCAVEPESEPAYSLPLQEVVVVVGESSVEAWVLDHGSQIVAIHQDLMEQVGAKVNEKIKV
ncbi:hypothetical protein BC826DRAFT_974002 [Russula brevipes]|nr:hypothetical protein BC826DRAFT_974002 [Russula brevipes]